MKKSRITQIFLKHLLSFMERMRLFPKSGKAFVAVSGGKDSMALWWALRNLKSNKLQELVAVYVNHNLRTDSDDEEKFVLNFARQHDLKLLTFKLDGEIHDNVEKEARAARYAIFQGLLSEGDVMYTAHHIDDSFEWSLLSSLKSSSSSASLGIPLVRGQYMRPLMCVTRAHIDKLVRLEKIPHVYDSSNANNRFERNYIRNVISQLIQTRFPNYLKHYAYRANDTALRVKKHRMQQNKNLVIVRDYCNGILIINKNFESDFSGCDEVIIESVKKLSNGQRGVLRSQVSKLIEASKNKKNGPLSFSGGVDCYIMPGMLYLIRQQDVAHIDTLDEKLSRNISETHQAAQIPGVSADKLRGIYGQSKFKFLGIVFSDKVVSHLEPIKSGNKLFPKTFKSANLRGMKVYHVGKVLSAYRKNPEKISNGHFYLPDKFL